MRDPGTGEKIQYIYYKYFLDCIRWVRAGYPASVNIRPDIKISVQCETRGPGIRCTISTTNTTLAVLGREGSDIKFRSLYAGTKGRISGMV